MGSQIIVLAAILATVGAAITCPKNGNCLCKGDFVLDLNCNIDGQAVIINSLTDTYVNVVCENSQSINYEKFPKLSANGTISLKSVTFKDCPLPKHTYKRVLRTLGVSKTMSLIIQNSKNWTGNLDRKHFAGLGDLKKLLLSFGGATTLPDNLFMDLHNLTWLNMRWRGQNLSENLFKPLEKLETLEISHNHMTNISSNLFSHLTLLRKLSLWQSNVTGFSEDLFSGVDVLEELDLSSNGLNELPATIFNPLKNLKMLTLFSNKFTSLPSTLFQKNKWLDSVIIFNNDVKLSMLPRGLLSRLPHLNKVYIQRCAIENIPYDLFYDSTEIKNISFANNDLRTLPKYVFNDQINLLELDLSHNSIEVLDSKMFSSLVKLEVLKLNDNFIQEIPGTTFFPLLSLIVLDLEYNRLSKIWRNSFASNNRPKMAINLAYNNLTFNEGITSKKYSYWGPKISSPLAGIFNLKLLNLSHNSISESFEDFWQNGHENVDISYNDIHHLTQHLVEKNIEKPMKQLWLHHNPLECKCSDYEFLNDLQAVNTKVYNFNTMNFTMLVKVFCAPKMGYVIMLLIMMSILLLACILRKEIIEAFFGRILQVASMPPVVVYAGKDEKFIFQEFLPEIMSNAKISDFKVKEITECEKFSLKKSLIDVFFCPKYIVIFSSNYLKLKYENIDIKKIRGQMNRESETLYIFVDSGPENSIYAFLKEHRNPNASLIWKGPNFWNNVRRFLTDNNGVATDELNNIITEYWNLSKEEHNQSDVLKRSVTDFNLI